MDESTHPLNDRQLLEAARDGSDEAWSALVERHRAPVEAVARARHGRGGSEVADRAFGELRGARFVDELAGNDARAGFAIRAVRPRVMSLTTGGTFAPWPVSEPRARDALDAHDTTLVVLATAFGRLSMIWQTVLWHRLVDEEPAAEITAAIGRTPTEVVAVEAAAERGLFEAYLAVELETDGLVAPACRPTVGLLGAYASSTLAEAQRRTVESHLGPAEPATAEAAGCAACRHRLGLRERLGVLVPAAVVPGITGMDVDRYRSVVGAGAAIGAAAFAAQRRERANRRARIGAAAAVVVALLLAAFLIRSPFDDLEGEIADLIDQATTTTAVPTPPVTPPTEPTEPTGPTGPTEPTGPPGPPGQPGPPSRIELVFPGVPQGITYVPGGPVVRVGLAMSVPAPVYRNGTGTIDAALTNETDAERSIDFVVRTSPGVSFDQLAEGAGSCITEGAGARCTLDLAAGRTAVLSLRFALDDTVADRLVVVPNIAAPVVDVPIETVPGLVLGVVGRGELVMAGNTLGPCPRSECAEGERAESAADLVLAPGTAVDDAVLVWSGPDPDAPGATSVALTLPGAVEAVAVDARRLEGDDEFTAVADVTALVRAGGAGSYAVEREGPSDAAGAWTLIVVTRDPGAPRRVMVAVDPVRPAGPVDPAAIDVPIAPPLAGPPITPTRPVQVRVVTEPPVDGTTVDIEVAVNGDTLEPPEPPAAYAAEIDANDDLLAVRVSATRALGVSVIGAAVDIVT